MHLLALDAELLVIEALVLVAHVPLAQPHLEIGVGRRGHTVGGRDHPAIGDQGTAAAQLTRQKAGLDEGHLPGVRGKARRVAAHDAIGSRVEFAAACKRRQIDCGYI